MIDANAIAAVSVSGVTVASGLLIAHGSRARLAGRLLVATGLLLFVGLWLLGSAHTASQTVLLIAGMILAPMSLWAYPCPRWRHPVDSLLAAALIGPGFVAVIEQSSALTMGIVAFLALTAQTWWRMEDSDAEDRRSLAWLALTASVAGLISLGAGFTSQDGTPAVSIGVLSAVPVAMVVGALRPETMDVRGLAVGAGVTATLVVGYIAYFVGALAALELIGISSPSPITLAGIGLLGGFGLPAAAKALRGVMDQLLFGDRPDPLVAANQVVSSIAENPAEALESVRSALALPFLELRRGEETVAVAGDPVPYVRDLPAGDLSLRVGLRPGDLGLSRADAEVLRLVAPLLAQIVRVTELSEDVQKLRTNELAAVAEERRRLRAELHDELGPTLTGIAFSTDAARNLLRSDPDNAAVILADVRQVTSQAIAQIRQIVYGMRPAALDQVGLVEALSRTPSNGLPYEVVVGSDIPDLPEAVEIAAYRVVVESLNNAARHSDATQALVNLSSESESLVIEVVDNGRDPQPWRPGVGMRSMQDRVSALGGHFQAGPTSRGGTVRAVFPTGS